ncbi:hypothetical protein BBP40_010167 [Aspergillus hancockii]|nr:hypothetical protein BBP40_010167 [Aspergillus hancockii]
MTSGPTDGSQVRSTLKRGSIELRDLPVEIILYISDALGSSKNIVSFALSTVAFHDVLLSAAYNFNVQHEGSYLLHRAASKSYLQMAHKLIDQFHADTNAVYKSSTPLINATMSGSVSIVELLLRSQNISIDYRDLDGRTALWYAASHGHATIADRLLQARPAGAGYPDTKNGWTPLIVAIIKGHEKIVNSLVKANCNIINIRDHNRQTPIFHAIRRQWTGAVNHLLSQQGINLGTRTSPINLAISYQNTALAEISLNESGTAPATSPQLVGVDDDLDHPSLCLAAATGQSDIVRLLLQYSVDVNARNGNEQMALHLAASRGHLSTVKLLLMQEGVKVNATDRWSRTPCHETAAASHLSVMKQLLRAPGIDVNAKDSIGAVVDYEKPPFGDGHATAGNARDVNANAVVERHSMGEERTTSLHHAVEREDEELVHLLLAKDGLDPNVPAMQRTKETQKLQNCCWRKQTSR